MDSQRKIHPMDISGFHKGVQKLGTIFQLRPSKHRLWCDSNNSVADFSLLTNFAILIFHILFFFYFISGIFNILMWPLFYPKILLAYIIVPLANRCPLKTSFAEQAIVLKNEILLLLLSSLSHYTCRNCLCRDIWLLPRA